MVPKVWHKPLWEGVWPCLEAWDSVGPHGELFFFLQKKEPMVLSELMEFGTCVSAPPPRISESMSLPGMHMMAEENASDSDSSADLGDVWSSDGIEGARSEDTSSLEY